MTKAGLAATICGVLLLCKGAEAAPLELAGEALTFGRITSAIGSDPVIHGKFVNKTNAPVNIERAQMSCGCMKLGVSNVGRLDPGKAVDISVTLDLKSMSIGKQRYSVTFLGSGLEVLGSSAVEYEFDPLVFFEESEINFVAGPQSPPTIRTAIAYHASIDPSDMDVAIEPRLEFQILPGINERTKLLQVSVPRESPGEFAKYSVRVFRKTTGKVEAEVPISIRYSPLIEVSPAAVIANQRDVKTLKRELKIRSRPGTKILGIDATAPWLSAQLAPQGTKGGMDGEGQDLTVLIEFSPSKVKQAYAEGEVRIAYALEGDAKRLCVVPVVYVE